MVNAMDPLAASPPSFDDQNASYRTMPHNLEAEEAMLGAILVNNEAAFRVATFLQAEHFYEPVHGRIFAAAMKLIERGQIATPVTLKAFFDHDEALADVGGAEYLGRLASAAVTTANAEDYGRIVYDMAMRRQLIQIGEEMAQDAFDADLDQSAMGQIEQAESQLFNLAQKGTAEGGAQPFVKIVKETIENAEAAHKRGSKLTGVATGLTDLDAKLGGLNRSELIILAGRPSMGKTALATNIAFNAARTYHAQGGGAGDGVTDGAAVAFFSLEMSAVQLTTRLLAEVSRVSSENIRRGQMTDDDFLKVVRASQDLEPLTLLIDDTPAITISGLTTRARRLKRMYNIGLVVVDYLQLLRPARERRDDSRVLEISDITQGLKALAKLLDVPVLALSQLNRAVEQREDKRPFLADLRESGAIEQDADIVMFIFREEYYRSRQQPEVGTPEHAKWQEDMERIHTKAEIIIAKHRHGPTGMVELQFEGEVTKFSNLARSDHLPDEPRF